MPRRRSRFGVLRRAQERAGQTRSGSGEGGGLPFIGDSRSRRNIPDQIRLEGEAAQERGQERDATRAETLSRIRSFDPTEFSTRVARSNFADLSDDLSEQFTNQRSRLNRRGLAGSNLGGSELNRDFRNRLARALASGGFQAASLEGRNIDRLAGVSSLDREEAFRTRGRELELEAGQADREQARENTIRELRERRKAREAEEGGFFGSLLGAAAGGLIGGAPGAGIGSRIGSRLPF